MPKRPKLAVILGAGASHDVCPDRGPIKDKKWTPPLVDTMFEGGALDEVLSQHPEAQALMSSVRTKLRAGGVFEEILRSYSDDPNGHIQWQMAFVPIALHEFFFRVSNNYTSEAINYSHLVNSTVGQGIQTAYVTLNYDTLLEMSLARITGAGFGNLDSYVSSPDWILVKLHGSVGWGYPWDTTERIGEPRAAALENEPPPALAESIEVGLPRLMWAHDRLFYPALSLPVVGKYGFVCPPQHIDALRRFMIDCANFLFVGFSAKDRDLLDFLADTVQTFRCLHVVAGENDLEGVVERLAGAVPKLSNLRVEQIRADGPIGFSNFGFSRYLEQNIDHSCNLVLSQSSP